MMKKKINLSKVLIGALLMAGGPTLANAQDKVEASAGADLVSSYIWRGNNCGGLSL